ncbi:MAG: Hint domain-containing protein [Pseudomonadota bacterium]
MATTYTVEMFYIGKFAEMDVDESNAFNEDPSLVLGNHDNLVITEVSEFDFDDDGVMSDDEYGTGDYLTYDAGGGATKVNLDSSSLYDADILLGDGSTLSVPVLVLQMANGDVFITEHVDNPLDGLAIQSINLVSLITSDAQGYYAGAYDVEGATIVCFTPGVMIDTQEGPRAVETLAPGDLVVTLDHGLQPVVWIRKTDTPLDGLDIEKRPVLISAGALGQDRPAQDLVVSPQHRIMVGCEKQLDRVFGEEAFVPAKALTPLPGVRHMTDQSQIQFIHFACARHEVVTANGCLTESLLLGPMVLQSLSSAEHEALHALFDVDAASGSVTNGPPARESLTVGGCRRKLAKTCDAQPALSAS